MALVTINWRPSPRHLRHFGLTMLGGFGLIGLLMMTVGNRPIAPYVAWGFGAVAGVLGLTGTKAALPIYWAWMAIAFVMGNIISRLALIAAFLLVVTPISLLMRLTGRDRLRLKRRSVDTYWQDAPTIKASDGYERQS
ncbi:MAG: SxtJ family membrane protein [Planctomycetota bacterium]|jgi:hypothetical protein